MLYFANNPVWFFRRLAESNRMKYGLSQYALLNMTEGVRDLQVYFGQASKKTQGKSERRHW